MTYLGAKPCRLNLDCSRSHGKPHCIDHSEVRNLARRFALEVHEQKIVLAISMLRADAPVQSKGGSMSSADRSSARGSARKVNANTKRGSNQPTSAARHDAQQNAIDGHESIDDIKESPRTSARATAPASRRPKRISSTVPARERSPSSTRDQRDDPIGFFSTRGAPASELEEMARDFGEQFLTAATSGQESHADAQDRIWEMELGGPFVISSDKRELARARRGEDGFEPEAFPTPSGPASVPPADELEEDED
jgi:hypothetical protein